jgi:hypothetical protein
MIIVHRVLFYFSILYLLLLCVDRRAKDTADHSIEQQR